MALVMVPIYSSKYKQANTFPKPISESAVRYNQKAIIPLLESKPSEFNMKFDNAIMQYATYSYQLLSLVGTMRKDKPDLPRELTESTLSMLTDIKSNFSRIDDKRITVSFVNALSMLENYVLLANDPKINVNNSKYNAALGANFGIWVCLIAILEILKSNNSRYKKKIASVIKKCEVYTKMLGRYVEIISRDHGRELTRTEMKALENIDSGRVKIFRYNNVDDYVRHLDEISVE
ncbi:MAG: hypothetical protein DLM72_14095 [Candidatus Nitrosopolaris wilkensis]|nr:MAG: hypothetical protein DLM72_14095 [Candidatus Nitrosopolaris wilkensis]